MSDLYAGSLKTVNSNKNRYFLRWEEVKLLRRTHMCVKIRTFSSVIVSYFLRKMAQASYDESKTNDEFIEEVS